MEYMKEVVVVDGVRTATGKFNGTLTKVKAYDMGAACIRTLVERNDIDGSMVDEVIMGNQFQAGNNANPARWAAIYGGLPDTVPAFTPMKNCGTGLKAVILGAQSIQTGDNEMVIAGGMESMTRCPYYLLDARQGYRMGHGPTVRDGLFEDGLLDPIVQGHMGLTAENLAKRDNITREEQDEFALISHHRAEKAWSEGVYQDDIVPIEIKDKKGNVSVFDHDETYRKGLTMDDLRKLKPAFIKDGTVTPGNASPLNDGAASLLLMSREKAEALSKKPIGKYVASVSVGYDPLYMGYAPVLAINKLLAKTGLTLDDIGLIELNEAFAAQSLSCIKALGLDMDKVNVNGGAIALGHATGCTGARITLSLLREMKRRDVRYGIVSLCIGGGQGIAVLYELI